MDTKFRIFLLEDDDNDAFLIERAVQRAQIPCELSRFRAPTEAMAALATHSSPERHVPHIIMTDLKMPGMSGLEFVQWLRKSSYSSIPVIMLSGSYLPEDILAAYSSGTNSFSTKPLNVHDLDTIVATVLKYWKEACRTPTSVWGGGLHLTE